LRTHLSFLRQRACPICPCFDKLCHDQDQTELIWLKSHAASNVVGYFVKGLSGKLLLSRFDFLPQLGDIKWCLAKVSFCFDFFELVTPNSGLAWKWQRTKLPLAARRCWVPL
jgi:hypothetical protein